MKRMKRLYFCMTYLFFVMLVSAQDSVRTIIISPRVGTVIDFFEKEQFGMFPWVQNFQNAVFYMNDDSTYFVKITFQTNFGLKETVMVYTNNSMIRMAERINHYEEMKEGTYISGKDPSVLHVVGGEAVTLNMKFQQTETIASDILPFAYQKQPKSEIELPTEFPLISFGVGYSSYHPDFSGLDEAFNTIEKRYRTSQYPISHATPTFETRRLFIVTLGLIFSYESQLLLETVNYEKFKAVSANFLYRFSSLGKVFRLLAGIGIGKYHFSGTVPYHQPIDNNYQFLDEIKYSGGAIGYNILCGLEAGSLESIRISGVLKNLYVPPVETTLPEGVNATVRLGSFMLEGRLELTL